MLRRLADRIVRWNGRTTEPRPWFSLVGAVGFGVALACVHAYHELWRDEMHCWTLARNAQGFWDLLTGVRRYDGHPILWYYLLHVASWFSRSVAALHVTTIVLGTLSSYLWLRDAPLPRALRVPLVATYLYFYEYSVLSRAYALGLFLLFLFCHSYQRQRAGGQRLLFLTLLLILLSFTSAYGAIIALALGAMLYLQSFADASRASANGNERTRAAVSAALGAVLFGLGLGAAWLTSLPPEDGFFAPRGILGTAPLWPSIPRSYWQANFPRLDAGNGTWVVNAAMGDEWLGPALPWLAVTWVALWLLAFRRQPWVAFAYAAGTAAIAAFQHYQYAGFLRHHGHYFVLLVACVWLYGKQRADARPGRLLYALFALTLAVQIATCVSAVRTEIQLPFSGALEASRFLRSRGLDHAPLVGSFDHHASAVAGYLDRPFRSAETYERVRSVVFHNRRWPLGMPLPTIFSVALAEAGTAGRPAVLILNREPGDYARPDAVIERLFVTAPPIVADERFWILRVTPVILREPAATPAAGPDG